MMKISMMALGLFAFLTSPALAQNINFGDDSGEWTNDGACDDPRFEGAGMAQPPLLFEDVNRDATDCGGLYAAGQLTRRGVSMLDEIDFGDDSSEYANDGECDDLRFVGEAMTATPLLASDVMHDASDCRMGFDVEALSLR